MHFIVRSILRKSIFTEACTQVVVPARKGISLGKNVVSLFSYAPQTAKEYFVKAAAASGLFGNPKRLNIGQHCSKKRLCDMYFNFWY